MKKLKSLEHLQYKTFLRALLLSSLFRKSYPKTTRRWWIINEFQLTLNRHRQQNWFRLKNWIKGRGQPGGISRGKRGDTARCAPLNWLYSRKGLSEINRVVKQSMDLAQSITTHYPKDWKSQIGHFNLLMTFTHAVLLCEVTPKMTFYICGQGRLYQIVAWNLSDCCKCMTLPTV